MANPHLKLSVPTSSGIKIITIANMATTNVVIAVLFGGFILNWLRSPQTWFIIYELKSWVFWLFIRGPTTEKLEVDFFKPPKQYIGYPSHN